MLDNVINPCLLSPSRAHLPDGSVLLGSHVTVQGAQQTQHSSGPRADDGVMTCQRCLHFRYSACVLVKDSLFDKHACSAG
jgi:hypothetical protein